MRLLLTELGNTASGDPELWAETCRRLAPAHDITLLHRLPDPSCLAAHGMGAFPKEALFLPPLPDTCASAAELDQALAAADPSAHERLHALVSRHDAVLIAPGGKFLDGYLYQNALAAAAAARLRQKPFLILHQSIGPLAPAPRRDLLAELVRGAALVLLRERHSHRFVRRLAGPLAHIHLTADPLLALPPESVGPPAYDVGLNFRLGLNGWVQPGHLLALAERLIQDDALRVLIHTTTHALVPELASALEQRGAVCRPAVLAPPDLLAVPGACRVNVTDSFHGVIFSLLAGRPAVMCQTDHDSWKLQGTFGEKPHPGPNTPARLRTLRRRIRQALRDPVSLHRRQTRGLPRLRARVESGWRLVEDSLRTER